VAVLFVAAVLRRLWLVHEGVLSVWCDCGSWELWRPLSECGGIIARSPVHDRYTPRFSPSGRRPRPRTPHTLTDAVVVRRGWHRTGVPQRARPRCRRPRPEAPLRRRRDAADGLLTAESERPVRHGFMFPRPDVSSTKWGDHCERISPQNAVPSGRSRCPGRRRFPPPGPSARHEAQTPWVAPWQTLEQDGLKGIPAKLSANGLDPNAERAKPRSRHGHCRWCAACSLTTPGWTLPAPHAYLADNDEHRAITRICCTSEAGSPSPTSRFTVPWTGRAPPGWQGRRPAPRRARHRIPGPSGRRPATDRLPDGPVTSFHTS